MKNIGCLFNELDFSGKNSWGKKKRWTRSDISKRIELWHGGRQKKQKSLNSRRLHRQYICNLLMFAICQKTC